MSSGPPADVPAGAPDAAPGAAPPRLAALTHEERGRVAQALTAEYGLLAGTLGAVWSASLVRTSLLLGVISAAGVALGFAAQADGFGPTFRTFALVVLPLTFFLGVATFVRTVEIQREAVIYITGMNRIRYFFQELAPGSRPYYVLPAHDDELAVLRSQGTGMYPAPPRARLIYAASQTQGIVGVVTSVLAAAIVGVGLAPFGEVPAWLGAVVAFSATLVLLFAYWQRSWRQLRASIRPINPTPPDEVGAPF